MSSHSSRIPESRIEIHIQKGPAVPYQHRNGMHYSGEALKEELIREAGIFIEDVKKGTMTFCQVEQRGRPFRVSDWPDRAAWIVRRRLGYVEEEHQDRLHQMVPMIKQEEEDLENTPTKRYAPASRVESWVSQVTVNNNHNNQFRRPLAPSQTTPRILARSRHPLGE